MKLLTKSKYIAGLQCPKFLWVQYHDRDRIPEPDAMAQHLFSEGDKVGELAKQLYPGGIDIDFGQFKDNLTKSKELLKSLNFDESTRIKDFNTEELNRIQKKLEDDYIIEGNLKRERIGNIKRLKEIKSYRGSRHAKNLTVRGQRTKTNSRTVRGNKRLTMGSGKTDSAQKT